MSLCRVWSSQTTTVWRKLSIMIETPTVTATATIKAITATAVRLSEFKQVARRQPAGQSKQPARSTRRNRLKSKTTSWAEIKAAPSTTNSVPPKALIRLEEGIQKSMPAQRKSCCPRRLRPTKHSPGLAFQSGAQQGSPGRDRGSLPGRQRGGEQGRQKAHSCPLDQAQDRNSDAWTVVVKYRSLIVCETIPTVTLPQQNPQPDPQTRARKPNQERFRDHQAKQFLAGHAQAAQRAKQFTALNHRKSHRVVDQEQADHQRQQAERGQVDPEGRRHLLHRAGASRRQAQPGTRPEADFPIRPAGPAAPRAGSGRSGSTSRFARSIPGRWKYPPGSRHPASSG